jgi:membrane protease YdiL (CAAX protease family)
MATPAAPTIESANAKLVAPPWHTAALVALFLVLALSGAFFQRQTRTQPGMLQQHPNVVPLYLSLIAMEWGLFFFVWKGGLHRTGTKPSDLIGGRWTSARDVLVDAALALGLWGFWTLLETSWVRWFGSDRAAAIQTLLPRRALEILLWIAVSVSAGICEEFVFRGYFQKQFEAFTHSRWIALLLQSLLFGISHGYQGIEACVKIAIYGSLFGLLALWRKSLRPGMMAHAWSDILSGIFGI